MLSFTRSLVCCLALAKLTILTLSAQSLDPSFAPTVLKYPYASYGYYPVRTMLQQPDGKVLVGGAAEFMNGAFGSRLRRLNVDGSLDTAFMAHTGVGPDWGCVQALTLQPDGKILVGAMDMSFYNGVSAFGLTRLNANGSVDTTFSRGGNRFLPGNVGNTNVRSIAVQADGKILVGGAFTKYDGQAAYSLLRLNPNGSLDTTFLASAGMSIGGPPIGTVQTILIQADGKIVVGGAFSTYRGVPVSNLIRLNPNGSLDTSFAIGTGADNSVYSLAQQPDGKLLAAGYFTTINGQPTGSVVRLTLIGAIDNTFQGGTLSHANNRSDGICKLHLRADGSMLIAGAFTTYNGAVRGSLAKLSSTGALDASFVSGTGVPISGYLFDIIEQANGQLLAGGSFYSYNGASCTSLVRLSNTAALDVSYTPLLEFMGHIDQLTPLPNGQLLVKGVFTSFNGTTVPATGFHLLNANGTYSSHISPAIVSTNTNSYNFLPDGKILALTAIGTTTNPGTRLDRMNPAGLVDASFTPAVVHYVLPPSLPSSYEVSMFTTANGANYLYGTFTDVNGSARPGLARLLPNGTLDQSFTPPATLSWVNTSLPPSGFVANLFQQVVGVQPDGKVVIQWCDTVANLWRMLRLNVDGSVDGSFTVPTVSSLTYYLSSQMLPNGQLLLNDVPPGFGGQPSPNYLVRLTNTGSVDPTFVAMAAGSSVCVQPDGRLLLIDTEWPGTHITRLNANGSRDTSFSPVTLPDEGNVYGSGVYIAFQPTDGKIILYGLFSKVAGQQRIGLARLTNTLLASRSMLAAPELTAYPNPARQQVTLQLPSAPATPQPVELFDMQGRAIRHWTWPAQQPEQTFPLTDVAAGIYLLRTTTSQGPVQRRVEVQ